MKSLRKTSGAGTKILAAAIAIFATLSISPVRAGAMLQGSYKDVPSPEAGNSGAAWWWDYLATQANSFRQAGFSAVCIPPCVKGAAGGYSSGAAITTGTYYSGTSQGISIGTTAASTGRYTFKIRSYNTPSSNAKPAYWLRTTYTAPQTL